MKTHATFFLLMAVFACLAPAQPRPTLMPPTLPSPDSCVVLALQNQAAMQNALLNVSAAAETRRAAFTKYFPTLSGSAGYFHATNPLIDLSTADTMALQRVPGIGPYYARRIADYRERLGGYVSLDQLDEIPNFPSAAKAFFVVSGQPSRRLDVNRLSLNELKRHPYINYYQARAIVDHRRNSGKINDLSDLRLLPDFPPDAIDRLRPYVSY